MDFVKIHFRRRTCLHRYDVCFNDFAGWPEICWWNEMRTFWSNSKPELQNGRSQEGQDWRVWWKHRKLKLCNFFRQSIGNLTQRSSEMHICILTAAWDYTRFAKGSWHLYDFCHPSSRSVLRPFGNLHFAVRPREWTQNIRISIHTHILTPLGKASNRCNCLYRRVSAREQNS